MKRIATQSDIDARQQHDAEIYRTRTIGALQITAGKAWASFNGPGWRTEAQRLRLDPQYLAALKGQAEALGITS